MKLCWHRMLFVLVTCTGLWSSARALPAQEIVDGTNFDGQLSSTGDTSGVVRLKSIDASLRVRHFEGADTAGFQDDFTSFEMLRPVWLNDFSMWFFDGRLGLTNESEVFGNTGLGFRRLNSTSTRTYGGSVWFDVDGRMQDQAQTYYQFGLGLESLGEIVDFRANFYKPIGDEVYSDPTIVSPAFFEGHSIFATETTRSLAAMQGLDLESSIRLPILQEFDFRGTAGYYHYRADGSEDINGVRGRLEISPYRDVTLLGQVQSDDTFGTTGFFAASWTFTKGSQGWSRGAIPGSLRDRMSTPVVRSYQIVLDDRVNVVQRQLSKTSNGSPFRIFHVDSSAAAGGDGTFESPFSTLAAASTQASDIIYAYADSLFNESVVLQSNQRLLGEGPDTHFINTVQLGTIALPRVTAGINRPIIQASAAQAVRLASNSEVSGFTITNSAGHGVSGNDFIGSVTLQNNTISNVSGSGIALNQIIGDVFVSNTDIINSGMNGILLQEHIGDFTFMNGSITGSTGTAVNFNDVDGAIAFSGTDINYTGGRVIDFNEITGGPVDFLNTTIANSNGTGIRVTNSTVDMTFDGASITSAIGDAVTLVDNTGSYTFNDLNVTTAAVGARGLVAEDSGTVNVTGNSSINASGGAAVDVVDSNVGMSFVSLASANSAGSGIRLLNAPGSFAANETTISESTSHGVHIEDSANLAASFQGTTSITGSGTPGSVGHGIFLADNAGSTFAFGTLDVDTENGGGLIARETGNVSAAGGTIIANGGPAVDASLTNIALTFDSLISNNSVTRPDHTGHGISLDQVTGRLTVNNSTTINDAAEAGIQLVNLNNSGTSINFLGTTTITNPATQGVNIANVSNGADIEFGQLDVIGHGATGLRIVNAAGDLDFGDTSIAAPLAGNVQPGISVQNSSADVTLASASVADSGGEGILLTNNTGSFTALGGVITDSDGTAFSVQGGTGDVIYRGDIINSSGLAINIANTTDGTITFPTSGGDIIDDGGNGVLIENVRNQVSIGNMTLLNTAGDGVSILNSTGQITFTNSQITDATGTGFYVSGGRPVVNYQGNIDNSAGNVVLIENTTNGNVDFTNGTISDDGGEGILLQDVDGDVSFLVVDISNTDAAASSIDIQGGNGEFTFSSASIDGSLANGFNVENSGATISYNSGSITNTTGTAFNVSGGAPFIEFGGLIANSSGRVVDIQNTASGQVAMTGAIFATGGQGIRVNNNGGNIVINSADITDTTDTGVSVTGNTRQLLFQDIDVNNNITSQPGFIATGNTGTISVGGGSSISTTNNVAVQISGVNSGDRTTLNANFESISATGTGFTNGLLLENVDGDFSVTGTGNVGAGGGTIDGATDDGIQITNAENVSLSFMQVINSGSLGVSGTGLENFSLIGTQVAGSGGVSIETLTPTEEMTTFTAQTNSITTTFGDGLTWLRNGDETTTVTANINGNMINASSEGIDLRLNDGFTSLLMNGNNVTSNSVDPNNGAAVNIHVGGQVNSTVTRNTMVSQVPNVFQAITDSAQAEFRLLLGELPTGGAQTLGNTVGNNIATSAFVLNNGSGGRFELVGNPFDSPTVTVLTNGNRTVDLDPTNNPDNGVNVNVIGTVNVVDPQATPFP